MKFTRLALDGACLIGIEPVQDARGFFARSFCSDEFREHGLSAEFPQHSLSFNEQRGTLRGLHYQQQPYAEAKLVRCLRGSIFDVIVDLRRSSPSFGKWLSFELSAQNRLALYVPEEFAHGFITLEADTEVHYMINRPHVPDQGCCLRWDDPHLGIAWPLQPTIMSDNDREGLALRPITT